MGNAGGHLRVYRVRNARAIFSELPALLGMILRRNQIEAGGSKELILYLMGYLGYQSAIAFEAKRGFLAVGQIWTCV